MENKLLDRWSNLLEKESIEPNLSFWEEIKMKYSQSTRYYHNFEHLETMFAELDSVFEQIDDKSIVSFSVFYHDVIYNSKSAKNEELSAVLAVERLQSMNLEKRRIERCEKQIIATKNHLSTDDSDLDYLLDADLVILGKNWEQYQRYSKNVREEYSMYPDFVYKQGRKKVLKHFLKMDRIFKTNHFFEKYEQQAKSNLLEELQNY